MMDTIEQVLKGTSLFEALSEKEFNDLANNASTLELPAGATIVEEGGVGQECYVIFDGMIQVFTTTADGQEVVLDKCQPRDLVGEQALVPGSNGRRSASLRAYSDVILIRLSKADFQNLLLRNHPLQERLLQLGKAQIQNRLLRQSALFRSLRFGEDGTDWYRQETFAGREVILRQGDPGDKAYVILSGTADVYHEEPKCNPQLLIQLGPGAVFGELALLEKQPRAATVIAHGPLQVLSIDGDRFLDLYDAHPEVREYMKTLKTIYPLVGGGFITQYLGTFLGLDCLTSITSLLDGTTAVSSLVIGRDLFHMSISVPETEVLETLRFEDPIQAIERELVFSNMAIVEVTSHGHWPELGQVYQMILERTPLTTEQINLFRQQGTLRNQVMLPLYQDHEIVCNCMQLTRGDLRQSIEGGCHTMEALMDVTGAGTVCGSCRVLLHEMVGQVDWTPVYIAEMRPVAEETRMFRLRPHRGALKAPKPGQHVLIQACIDGNWVQRPYTISSSSHETRYYDITVKHEPHGLFSGWLFDGEWEGTLIRISDPQGEFCVDTANATDPIVCLVGGIGMTPALAMCRSLAPGEKTRPLHIDYSATTQNQFAYADELQEIAAANDNIDVTLRTTSEDGRLSQSDVAQLTQQYPHAHYYICGPDPYQQAAETYLHETDVEPDHIHIETFTPIGDRPAAPSRLYFYLGMALFLAFALQDVLQLKWPWLEALQTGESYKRWSGLLLALYLAGQFVLPFLRWQGKLRTAGRHYHLHKLQGTFAPLVFYLHATSIGYAYLLVLSVVYFANFLLGLLNHVMVARPKFNQRYQVSWIIGHVGLSLITVALMLYHIYIVFAYQ